MIFYLDNDRVYSQWPRVFCAKSLYLRLKPSKFEQCWRNRLTSRSGNEFFIPLVIAIKPATQTLPVGIMSFVGVYSTEWWLVFASVVVSALPVVVAYVLLTRQFVAGISAGAVKG